MKILIVNARFLGYHGRDMFPIGIGYLAGLVDKYGDVSVLDLNVQTDIELEERLKEKPEIVCISCTTPSFPCAVSVIEKAKQVGSLVIIGGSHVSFEPEQALEAGADIVVRGEADITIKEVFEAINFSSHSEICEAGYIMPRLYNIKGISYKNNGKTIHNPDREMLDDLNFVPFPAYEKFPLEKYPILSIATSRGCPYNCSYCCASKFWGNKIRLRSAENVLEELRKISKLGIERIKFHDSTFTFDRQRVLDICDKMISEGLRFKWSCETRADTLDKELLEKMKEAGCLLICIGVDSGCQQVLDASKRNINLKKMRDVFLLSRKIGIRARAYVTFGLPGENSESVLETIKFLKEIKPNQIMLSLATAYPGTELNIGKKIKMPDNWKKKFDGHGFGAELYLPDGMSREEYKRLADLLWTEVREMKKEFKLFKP